MTGATFYGVLFTGLHDENGPSAPTATGYEPWDPAQFPPLQRFLVDHVTAYNNGLYGIYALQCAARRHPRLLRLGLGGQRVLCRPVRGLRHPRDRQRRRAQRRRVRERQRERHGRRRGQPLLGEPRRDDAAVELPGGIHAAARQRRGRQSRDRQRRSRLPRAGRGRLRDGSGTERRTGQRVRPQPDRRQSAGRRHPQQHGGPAFARQPVRRRRVRGQRRRCRQHVGGTHTGIRQLRPGGADDRPRRARGAARRGLCRRHGPTGHDDAHRPRGSRRNQLPSGRAAARPAEPAAAILLSALCPQRSRCPTSRRSPSRMPRSSPIARGRADTAGSRLA